MIQPRPRLNQFEPIQPVERTAKETFLAAYNSPEERPIKDLFEVLAEYDMTDDYLRWCDLRHANPDDAWISEQYEAVHWTYLVAWRMLGWQEFQRRLTHARLIVHSLNTRWGRA